jgi:hypothetical protein
MPSARTILLQMPLLALEIPPPECMQSDLTTVLFVEVDRSLTESQDSLALFLLSS